MMDDIYADVQCEKCGKEFEIRASIYEKAIGLEQPILCVDCFDKDANEQYQEVDQQRCFEYCDINCEEDFTTLGLEGWELVTIHNRGAYFKRELFK